MKLNLKGMTIVFQLVKCIGSLVKEVGMAASILEGHLGLMMGSIVT